MKAGVVAWRPVTAEEYDREVAGVCAELEWLLAAVRARFAGRGATAAAPRLAAGLRALRETLAALRAGPGLDE